MALEIEAGTHLLYHAAWLKQNGKPFKKGEELDRALAELETQFVSGSDLDVASLIARPSSMPAPPSPPKPMPFAAESAS